MSAPDRIWIDGAVNANVWAEQKTDCTLSGVAAYEYVRADLCDPMADKRVKALVEALQGEDERGYRLSPEAHAALRALLARHKKT